MEKLKNVDIAMLVMIVAFSLLICFPEESISVINGEVWTIDEVDSDIFQKWLANDSTKNQLYDGKVYNCKGFSEDLAVNASKEGFVIYYAIVDYSDSENHKINAVYDGKTFLLVEPQTGEVLNLSEYVFENEPIGVFILSTDEKFVKRLY